MKQTRFLFLLITLVSITSCDVLNEVAKEVYGVSSTPSTLEMGNGLKEALTKGTAFAVNSLSKEGGYFNDPLVKIPFP